MEEGHAMKGRLIMAKSLKGKYTYCLRCGPTMVIHQSHVGAIVEAKRHQKIQNIHGALHGIKGILNEEFIDLTRGSNQTLNQVVSTPHLHLVSCVKDQLKKNVRKFSIS